MKAIYTKKPEIFEEIDQGIYYYRWGIIEKTTTNPLTNQTITQWECEQFDFTATEDDLLVSNLPKIALAKAKEQVIGKIIEYDSSRAVNTFYFRGVPFWLDKSTRVGLMNSTTIEKAIGRETTEMILGDEVNITLPVDTAIQMLYLLEVYAKDCYNVTAKHRLSVEKMTQIEEVLDYDFTQGYPDKPNF